MWQVTGPFCIGWEEPGFRLTAELPASFPRQTWKAKKGLGARGLKVREPMAVAYRGCHKAGQGLGS